MTHDQLKDILLNAWDQLWDLVCAHPELVKYRETQVHIELAHLVLLQLENAKLIRGKDYSIFFDTPDALHRASDTTIGWRLVSEIRPDILIYPRSKMAGSDQRGFCCEIKCLRSWADKVDEEFGIVEVCNVSSQSIKWDEDIQKLEDVATAFYSQLRGVMFTLHYHNVDRGPVSDSYAGIAWDEEKEVNKFVFLRRSIKFIDGQVAGSVSI